jgi:hypothetical protein
MVDHLSWYQHTVILRCVLISPFQVEERGVEHLILAPSPAQQNSADVFILRVEDEYRDAPQPAFPVVVCNYLVGVRFQVC